MHCKPDELHFTVPGKLLLFLDILKEVFTV